MERNPCQSECIKCVEQGRSRRVPKGLQIKPVASLPMRLLQWFDSVCSQGGTESWADVGHEPKTTPAAAEAALRPSHPDRPSLGSSLIQENTAQEGHGCCSHTCDCSVHLQLIQTMQVKQLQIFLCPCIQRKQGSRSR